MTETFEVVRTIPVPSSVSPEAQRFLASGLALANADAAGAPAADDLDAWRSLIEGANEGLAMAMEMRVAHLDPTVEVMAVGDVPVFVLTPDGGSDDAEQ